MLLSPREPLVAGGAAEAFERQLQQLIRAGYRNLVVDLAEVDSIDSAGIRALVRAHTSARRVEGTLRLAAAGRGVAKVIELSNLGGIFQIYESVDAAKIAAWPWDAIRAISGGTALCATLVWAGVTWPVQLSGISATAATALTDTSGATVLTVHPFVELAKLVAAALIGILVTAVHQPASRDRGNSRSMEQAQMLLCMSGALMMIIIGNSLARAFGIAGAASIIRFRTPVDDPKDVTILFLLMGLGMSAGLGAFAVAGLGTAFLCLTLVALDVMAKQQTRVMSVEIVADGRTFPSTRVEEIFARNQIVFEPREIAQADDVTVKYHAWLDPRTSLDDLSAQLMREVAGLTSVSWEHPKRV
ncbi:MAG TPA: STAS domain-containing protein [Vicinamibacterales bacterium]